MTQTGRPWWHYFIDIHQWRRAVAVPAEAKLTQDA